MIMLENKTIEKDIITSIINIVKTNFDNNNYQFDVDITDEVNIWCDNDKDKTVYVQTKDENSYATFTKQELDVMGRDELKKSINYQLTETGLDND